MKKVYCLECKFYKPEAAFKIIRTEDYDYDKYKEKCLNPKVNRKRYTCYRDTGYCEASPYDINAKNNCIGFEKK